ncbi:glycoside hydrolase family 127 protein [Draconibacterium sp.]|nr:glycoside hydrolase family 127 protein [Draconibacterium sp.]
MRLRFAVILLIILFSSCSKRNNLPEKISNKIPLEELKFSTDLKNSPIEESFSNMDFSALKSFVSQFESKDDNFNLLEFESKWNAFSNENDMLGWSDSELKIWAEITGLLLELTNSSKYAEELERIASVAGDDLQEIIAPYILTKRIDHIYVNLFQPIEINYSHTLGGEVKFWQETNYPKSGSVRLHFGMTERRYIELFIRIPGWAKGSTVTVKKVKYFAAPGTYCKIAKKWNEGDVVEIKFPIEKYQIK